MVTITMIFEIFAVATYFLYITTAATVAAACWYAWPNWRRRVPLLWHNVRKFAILNNTVGAGIPTNQWVGLLDDYVRNHKRVYIFDGLTVLTSWFTTLLNVNTLAAIAELKDPVGKARAIRSGIHGLAASCVTTLMVTTRFLGLGMVSFEKEILDALTNQVNLNMGPPPPYSPRAGTVTESDVIAGFITTMVAGLAAGYHSRKTWVEVMGHVFQNWGKTANSSKSLMETLRGIWSEVNPDDVALTSFNSLRASADRLTEIFALPNDAFVKPPIQAEIKHLIDVFETRLIKAVDTKDDAIKQIILRHNGTYAKIMSRQDQLNAVIQYAAQARRKPVMYNLTGPYGHGKSFLIEKMYDDLSRWMMAEGHLKTPMRRMIGTSSADDYLPPMSDQEWYQVDEYLLSSEDKWIGVINQVVSDNPTMVSSAFVKFTVPRPHFLLTTSNVTLPFKPPTNSKNFMRDGVLDAWNSRHKFVEFVQPDYDENVDRDRQVRAAAPKLTYKKFVGKCKWVDEPITYDELIERMKDDWKLYEQKRIAAEAKADALLAAIPETTAEDGDANLGNPRVLGLYGNPGSGKTYLLNNEIIPVLKNVRKIKHYRSVPDTPDLSYTCHIFDDVVALRREYKQYKDFFDQCRSTDLIILVDNWMPTRRLRLRNPLMWWSSLFFNDFWKWWDTRFTFTRLDVSELPHESLGRRLGISTTHLYRGKKISPAVAGIDALEIRADCIIPINEEILMAYPASYVQDVVLPNLIHTVGALKMAEPHEDARIPDTWDVEIRLEKASHAARAVVVPTDIEYVKADPSLVASFPDYMSYFNLDPTILQSPRELFPSMAAAFRRRPYTAFISVGRFWIKVLDGKFFSSDYSWNAGGRMVIRPDRICVVFEGDETITIPFVDIHHATVTYMTNDPKKVKILASKCDQVRTLTVYKKFIQNHIYESYKMELTTRCTQSWNTLQANIRKHPKFAFLVGGVAVTIAAVAAYRHFYPTEKTKPKKSNSSAESYEQPKNSEKTVRSPVRTIPTGTAVPESYEQVNKQAKVTRTPVRNNINLGDKATAEAVDGLVRSSGLSPEMSSIIEKLRTAMCICCQSSGTVFGIFIGGNKVLSVGHYIDNPREKTQVITRDNGILTSWEGRVIACDPHRDLSIVEICDKTFPARPDMRKHFAKARDMKNIYETYHYLPTDRILAPGNATFATQVDERAYTDPNTPGWNPTKRLIVTDFLSISKVTRKGDCGTAVLTPQPQFGARLIVGVHIASTGAGHTTGLVATVSEEDISALLGETSAVESQNDPGADWTAIDYGFDDEKDGHERQGNVFISPEVEALTGGDMEPTWHQIPETDRLQPVGFLQRCYAPSHRRGGKLVRSPLSPYLPASVLPNLKVPAPVSFNDPIIEKQALESLVKDAYGRPSIGATQLAKIAGPLYDISKETEDRLVRDYVSMMKAWPGIEDWRILTDGEVMNGWDHPQYQGLVGAMKMDTSPGFPYKQLFNINSKGDLFERVGDQWEYADTKGGAFLQDSVSRLMRDGKHGYAHFHVVEAHLKVETLPIEKAAAGKTRLFLLESVDQVMFQKKIFGALQGIMMKSRWSRYQHATTGINPYVEFKTLYQRLKSVGNNGWDGDYERFDKSTPPWVKRVMRRIFEEMFIWLKWYVKHTCQNLAKAATKSLFDKFYLFEGAFWASFFDWSSGNGMTNPFGSLINDLYIIVASYGAWDKHATHALKHRFGNDIAIEDLHDLMMWFTHGDDVAASTHPLVEDVFSFRHISEEMALFGMRMTPAHKNEAVYDHKPIESLSFIGREFEFDETSLMNPHGKLRFSAMCGMLHWTEAPNRAQMFSVLDSFAIELRAYPKKEYEEMVEAVAFALKKLNWGYIFSPWEQARTGLKHDQMFSFVVEIEMEKFSPCDPRSCGNRLNVPKLEAGELSDHTYACVLDRDTLSLPRAGILKVTCVRPTQGRGSRRQTGLGKGAEEQRESSVKTDEYQTPTKVARISESYVCQNLLEKIEDIDLARDDVFCTIHGGSTEIQMKKNISMDKLNKKNAQDQLAKEYDRQTPFVKGCIDLFATEKDNEFRTIPVKEARRLISLKTHLSDRFVAPNGMRVSAAGMEGHQLYHGKSVLPRALWGEWSCMSCTTAPIGFPALVSHVANSHVHLEGVNASLKSGVNNADETTTPKVDPLSKRLATLNLLADVEMSPELANDLAIDLVRSHVEFAKMAAKDLEEVVVLRYNMLPHDVEEEQIGKFRFKRFRGKLYFLGQALQRQVQKDGSQYRELACEIQAMFPTETTESLGEVILHIRARRARCKAVTFMGSVSEVAEVQMDAIGAGAPVTGSAGTLLDPNTGVGANQTTTMESEANTAGMRPVAATPGMLSGSLLDPSAAICMRASGLPMAIGASTGAQWNVQDVALGAPSIVFNGGLSSSGFPEGTPIFDLPLYTFGGPTKDYIEQHKYLAGPTEFQVRFTGVTNTSGEFIVYDEEDPTQDITTERALQRPNVIFSASNGVTISSFLLEDAQNILRSRKTTGEDPATYPCLRAVVLTPLENSFGTELSLNIKVLSRPGTSPINGPFRVWGPTGTAALRKPDTINLPMVNYINIDANRRIGLTNYPHLNAIETTGYRALRRNGTTALPRGIADSGIFPNVEGTTKTGFLRPLYFDINRVEMDVLTANVQTNFIQTNIAVPELILYETDGRAVSTAADSVVTNDGNTGYVGVPGQDFGSPIESSVYATGYLRHAQYKYASPEDFEEAWAGAVQTDARDIAEGALSQPDRFRTESERAIFPSGFIQPTIPANVDAAFAAVDWESSKSWADAILAWRGEDRGEYLAELTVDGKVLGKVRLTEFGTDRRQVISCIMEDRYLELEPTQTIILGKLQRSFLLPSTMSPTGWNSRVVARDVNQERLDFWREKLSVARKALKSCEVRRRPRKGVIHHDQVCVVEAGMIAGGILGGLGQGLGQWSQNQFWEGEFDKNREHEKWMAGQQWNIASGGWKNQMDMLGAQLGFSKEQMEMQKRQHDNALKGDHNANMGLKLGAMARNGISMGRTPKMVGVAELPSVKGETAMQSHARGAKGGVPTPTAAPRTSQPATLEVKAGESIPAALKRTKNPGVNDVAPKPQGPGVQIQGAQSPPLGNTTSGAMEQYHPASVMAGAQINPTQVLSAQAPYTESMKRQ